MRRVFIAEKKNLARDIAKRLAPDARETPGHFVAGNDVVTWCSGHILEQAEPEFYLGVKRGTPEARWRMDVLPIVPKDWRLFPIDTKWKARIEEMKNLIANADLVVNAGDAEREGELIVREVLDYIRNKKPVKRLWLSALDDASMDRALNSLREPSTYDGLHHAALARQRGDWLIGFNGTRAFTLAYQNATVSRDGINVGRVMSPTLGLVVERGRQIKNFVSRDYFAVSATMSSPSNAFPPFKLRWIPPKEAPWLDEEGRVIDVRAASAVSMDADGQPAEVADASFTTSDSAPALPYSLDALQKDADQLFGFSPSKTLEIAQSLYDAHKMTTYPRTDCNYLPEEQFAAAPLVARAIAHTMEREFDIPGTPDFTLKSPAWNSKKLSSHHAIIPTENVKPLHSLSPDEQKIYRLVAVRFLMQFYPPAKYNNASINVIVSGRRARHLFRATSRFLAFHGWMELEKVIRPQSERNERPDPEDDAGTDRANEDAQTLPRLKAGDAGTLSNMETITRKTTPPKFFTKGTLGEAMKEIHRYITSEQAKKMIREKGLGTPATRAPTIEKLVEYGYIEEFGKGKRKQVRATDLGEHAFDCLPDMIRRPDWSSVLEQMLQEVEEGKKSIAEVEDMLIRFAAKLVEIAKSTKIEAPVLPECIKCGSPMRRIKGKNGFFWGCTNQSCRATANDKNGQPVFKEEKAA